MRKNHTFSINDIISVIYAYGLWQGSLCNAKSRGSHALYFELVYELLFSTSIWNGSSVVEPLRGAIYGWYYN